jgi:AcrR family transcriptional regulator
MGVLERRQREKEARHAAIIETAQELFYRQGYERTRMSEIAEACELSKGTLYLYFRTKEELARAVVIKSYDILTDLMERALAQGTTGREKIETVLQAFLRFYSEYYQHFYLILVLESYLRDRLMDNATWPEYNECLQHIKSIAKATLELGIMDGSIRPDIDPDLAAVTAFNAAAGFFHRIVTYGMLVPDENIEPKEYVRELFRILLHALT